MKKFLLAAALVMVSASAMADRVVSGETFSNYETSKASACQDAKEHTEYKKHDDEQVESFSKCECDQTKDGHWKCSVDANLEKKR